MFRNMSTVFRRDFPQWQAVGLIIPLPFPTQNSLGKMIHIRLVFIRLNQIPFNSQRFICFVLSLSFITYQLCKTHHTYNTKTRHIIPWSYNRLSSGLKSGWFHTDVLSLAKSVLNFFKIISKQFMFSGLKIHSCAVFNFFFLNIQYNYEWVFKKWRKLDLTVFFNLSSRQ